MDQVYAYSFPLWLIIDRNTADLPFSDRAKKVAGGTLDGDTFIAAFTDEDLLARFLATAPIPPEFDPVPVRVDAAADYLSILRALDAVGFKGVGYDGMPGQAMTMVAIPAAIRECIAAIRAGEGT